MDQTELKSPSVYVSGKLEIPHGFTLTVRELPDRPEDHWVELRFNKPPDEYWQRTAQGILDRMSCSMPVEFHKCRSRSPQLTQLIMDDALDAL